MNRIVVIGAGPAGIAAAVRAREAGAAVTVVDDNPSPGGQIWRRESSLPWLKRFRAAEVEVFSNARVVGAGEPGASLLVEQGEQSFEMQYDRLILATGARELFLPFPGWTLPGIAGVGGLQALAKAGLPIRRKRIVVAGSGPLLLAAAEYFRKHHADVLLIAEQASSFSMARFGMELMRHPAKLRQAAQLQTALLGVPFLRGCWVERAEGQGKLERLRLRAGDRTFSEEVDYAAIAYGLTPNTELASALGCDGTVDDLQRTSIPGVYSAGECTGIGGVELSLVEGEIAGFASAGREGDAAALLPQKRKAAQFASAIKRAFAPRPELRQLPAADTIVCRCEDVTYARLKSQTSFRSAKLHTRCGMGPCQGRICGPATDFLFGWHTESIRPPIFPARIRTLANL